MLELEDVIEKGIENLRGQLCEDARELVTNRYNRKLLGSVAFFGATNSVVFGILGFCGYYLMKNITDFPAMVMTPFYLAGTANYVRSRFYPGLKYLWEQKASREAYVNQEAEVVAEKAIDRLLPEIIAATYKVCSEQKS